MPIANVDPLINWSPWVPHDGCWRGSVIPAMPGLYRIRRVGLEHLDYLGQTGMGTMTLRKRLGMLKGIYNPEMPYRDPHTAGPALWALRHQMGTPLEVSVAIIEGSTPWRKALEAVALSDHRVRYGRSPTVNFGRMPVGYRMSSQNNAKIVEAGRRFRGGPTSDADQSHIPGVPPVAPFSRDVTAEDWCGHLWSPWMTVGQARGVLPASGTGLYRLRDAGRLGLLYIGEGRVGHRIRSHLRKVNIPGDPQGLFLAAADQIQASWVLNDAWLDHHRLELENDLIAAYVLATGDRPDMQYLG